MQATLDELPDFGWLHSVSYKNDALYANVVRQIANDRLPELNDMNIGRHEATAT